MPTTIQVSDRLKRRLLKHKTHPRQPYEEVIEAALDYMEEDEAQLNGDAKKALAESRRQFKAGRFKSLDEIKDELGL
jgi:predicted transcriptional regulator